MESEGSERRIDCEGGMERGREEKENREIKQMIRPTVCVVSSQVIGVAVNEARKDRRNRMNLHSF